jgi:hypothetical protein
VNYDFDGAQKKLAECEQVSFRLFLATFMAIQFAALKLNVYVPICLLH